MGGGGGGGRREREGGGLGEEEVRERVRVGDGVKVCFGETWGAGCWKAAVS